MAIEKGMIYTPEKKQMLVQEVKDELAKLDNTMKRSGLVADNMESLKKIRTELVDLLKRLFDKKGVVTPQETDTILESITLSKKARLNNENPYKINAGTLLLVLVVGYGIYYISKRKS